VLEGWQPGSSRSAVFDQALNAQADLHGLLTEIQGSLPPTKTIVPGIDLRERASFSVSNLRLARRTGALGEFRNEMVVEVVQAHRPTGEASVMGLPPRGGATLIVDLADWKVRYVIYKRLYARLPLEPGDETGQLAMRLERHAAERRATADRPRPVWQGEDDDSPYARLARTYSTPEADGTNAARLMRREPFRLLHHFYDRTLDGEEGGRS
jgi:hypothetical protein